MFLSGVDSGVGVLARVRVSVGVRVVTCQTGLDYGLGFRRTEDHCRIVIICILFRVTLCEIETLCSKCKILPA